MDTRGDIVRPAHRGLGVSEFSLAAARALRRAVPFDGVCVGDVVARLFFDHYAPKL